MELKPKKVKIKVTYKELLKMGSLINEVIISQNVEGLLLFSLEELRECLRGRAGNGDTNLTLNLDKTKAFALNYTLGFFNKDISEFPQVYNLNMELQKQLN